MTTVYSEEIIQLSKEEREQMEKVRKGLVDQLNVLFDIEFRDLNRMNSEEFLRRINSMVSQLRNFIDESEYPIIEAFQGIEEQLSYAKKYSLPETSPWKLALEESFVVHKSMHKSITYRSGINDILKEAFERSIGLILQLKNVEMEKLRADTLKESWENLFKKQDERHAEDIKNIERHYEKIILRLESHMEKLEGKSVRVHATETTESYHPIVNKNSRENMKSVVTSSAMEEEFEDAAEEHVFEEDEHQKVLNNDIEKEKQIVESISNNTQNQAALGTLDEEMKVILLMPTKNKKAMKLVRMFPDLSAEEIVDRIPAELQVNINHIKHAQRMIQDYTSLQ